jgi:protein-S-isoprenylcysteine O-methyltransferase Ste14
VSAPLLLLYLLNFGFIGALPRIFFKKGGSYNPMWWLTASPFFVCAAALVATSAGVRHPLLGAPFVVSGLQEVLAVPFAAASIALIALTISSHQRPIALWHQQNDAPEHITTHGAYRYIRHPFYASFLLALLGATILSPQPLTLLALVGALVQLNRTAAREEGRLCASAFGAEYAAYMQRTGRFLPGL